MPDSIHQDSPSCPRHSCESCENCVQWADREFFAEALEDSLDNDSSGKWETVAGKMEVDVSLLSKWTGSRKNPMPAWRLIPYTLRVSPDLLRRLVRRCGWDLVRIEKPLQERPHRG